MLFGSLSVVDLKISRQAEPWHGVQLAGYALGLPHEKYTSPMGRFMARGRYIAKLDEHGKKAKLLPYFNRSDADVFRSALVVAHWKLLQGKQIAPLELLEEAA
jgi:hypothetical protein